VKAERIRYDAIPQPDKWKPFQGIPRVDLLARKICRGLSVPGLGRSFHTLQITEKQKRIYLLQETDAPVFV